MTSDSCLVTGGSGFLGLHLIDRLLAQGWEVHATSRSPRHSSGGEHWHVADFQDLAQCRRVISKVRPSVVFHLAGSVGAEGDPELVLQTYHSHVTSTVNLLTTLASRASTRVLLVRSFLEPSEPLDSAIPMSPYAAAKTASTLYGRMFWRLYGVPVILPRVFMAYGPGQNPSKVLPYVIRSIQSGKPPKLSSGSWRADWIYIEDAVEGLYRCATTEGLDGKTVDIGWGKLVSVADVARTIGVLMDARSAFEFGARQDRPGEIERAADVISTEQLTGWRPAIDLAEGLRRTIESFIAAD